MRSFLRGNVQRQHTLRRVFASLAATFTIASVATIPSAHADITGATVNISESATATVGDALIYKVELNCTRPGGCDDLEIQLERPGIVGEVPIAVDLENNDQHGYTLSQPEGPSPIIKFSSLRQNSVAAFNIYWPTSDRPGYVGEGDFNWSAHLGDDNVSGTSHFTITGAPETSLQKSASVYQLRPGDNIEFTIQFDRTRAYHQGLTGVLVDQLPEELENIEILNPDLGEPVSDNADSVISNPDRLLSARYISYDEATHQLRINLDESTYLPIKQKERLFIKYSARVRADVDERKTIRNIVGFDENTLSLGNGTKIDKNSTGVANDADTEIIINPQLGSGKLSKRSGHSAPRRNGSLSNYQITYSRPGNDPVTITDTLRPQTCRTWEELAYKGTQCSREGGNNEKDFRIQYLNFSPINGKKLPATINFISPDGQNHEVTVEEEDSIGTYKVEVPAGFDAVDFTLVTNALPSSAELKFWIYGIPVVPASVFSADDPHDVIQIWNDIEATSGSLHNVDFAAIPVAQDIADPQVLLRPSRNSSNTFDSQSHERSVDFYFDNKGGAAYPLDAYIAVPRGFTLDPEHRSFSNYVQVCLNNQGDNPTFDPRELIWELQEATSPSGGQIWRVRTPDGKSVPAHHNYNGCQVSVPLIANGAITGEYTNPDLASDFPTLATYVGSQDANQPVWAQETPNAKERDNGDTRITPDDTHRWARENYNLSQTSYAAARLTKSVRGDHDATGQPLPEGEFGPSTTFTPGSLRDTSIARHQAVFSVTVSSAGSQPLTDVVLYDALPNRTWIRMNDQETEDVADLAGTANPNTIIPTLNGQLAVPTGRYLNDNNELVDGQLPALICYSTSEDPHRPEAKEGYPDTPVNTCGDLGAEWANSLDDYSQARYIRIALTRPFIGNATFDMPMTMPERTVNDTVPTPDDVAVNRVIMRSRNSVTNNDLGISGPAVARVRYPEATEEPSSSSEVTPAPSTSESTTVAEPTPVPSTSESTTVAEPTPVPSTSESTTVAEPTPVPSTSESTTVAEPTPAPSTSEATPVPSTTEATPVPSTTEATPVPSTTEATPVPSTTEATPVPSTTEATPVPSTTEATPVPSTTEATPVPSTTEATPVPSTRESTTVAEPTPAPSTSEATPVPSTSEATPAPSTTVPTPVPSTTEATPVPSSTPSSEVPVIPVVPETPRPPGLPILPLLPLLPLLPGVVTPPAEVTPPQSSTPPAAGTQSPGPKTPSPKSAGKAPRQLANTGASVGLLLQLSALLLLMGVLCLRLRRQ